MHRWMSALFFATLAGCVQVPVSNRDPVPTLSRNEYESLIKRNTKSANQYSGLYQTFQSDVTQLNSEVQAESLKQKAHFLQWNQVQYQLERDKMIQESAAYAKFFLRFYTPERDYDDLDKGKSIWKVYLEYSGNRFDGKVHRLSDKLIEIQAMYPHMNRFSTAYEVSFNVPMSTIETGIAKVVVTSSLGTAEFSFRPSTKP
jgi:hypothetical protein